MITAIIIYISIGVVFNLYTTSIILPKVFAQPTNTPSLGDIAMAILLSPLWFVIMLCLLGFLGWSSRSSKVHILTSSLGIRPGDIFFIPKHGIFGYLIYRFQKIILDLPNPFVGLMHTGYVKHWPIGIHSTGKKGVHEFNIPEKYPVVEIYRHTDLIEDSERAAYLLGVAETYLGKDYDLLSLLGFPLRYTIEFIRYIAGIDPKEDVFCSEFVVDIMRKIGLPVCIDTDKAELVSPGMLAMDRNLIKITTYRK